MASHRMAGASLPRSYTNLLMRSLHPGDLRLIAPHLEPVHFAPGANVVSPDLALTHILFPETLLVGFREGSGSAGAQIGMVGREGMIGWPLLLGGTHSPLLGVAQLHGGTALALPASRFRVACGLSDTLADTLLRFVHNFMMQLTSTILSGADPIERRVARWLLMLHDRTGEDALPLTHDHVSNALRVRRASVTDCLHVLEGEGLLRCVRGRIMICDRDRLRALAGESYGSVEAHYSRDIGPMAMRPTMSIAPSL